MRHGSVKELLSRIKYDPKMDEKEYYIVIEHRSAEGDEKKIPIPKIELGGGTSSLVKRRYRTTE